MQTVILSIKEAAEWFDTTVATIRGLIRAHGIRTKRVRNNGRAKGLDLADLRIIARSLGRPEPTVRAIESRFAAVA